jgi:hypothetical protein
MCLTRPLGPLPGRGPQIPMKTLRAADMKVGGGELSRYLSLECRPEQEHKERDY